MTDSPSDTPAGVTTGAATEPAAGDEPGADLGTYAARVAGLVGASRWSADHGTAKLFVERGRWHEAVTRARDDAGLEFFSWLSAIDWSADVAVGDPVEDAPALVERYELLCCLATIVDGRAVVLSTSVDKEDPVVASISDVFRGADWHEREAHEMFGIDFAGHPRLMKLYLPDAFEGHPLRKSYPLLSREVKPWPGLVDVEDMPSTENPEAAAPESPAEPGPDSPGEAGDV